MAGAARHTLLARLVTPGGDDPLLLTIVAPAVIRTGAAVSGIALVGKGGAGGYVYSIVTGSLPTGLSLNGATGAITGTPTVPGNFSFVAQVQDAAASVYQASFSIRISSRLIRKHKAIRPGEVGLSYTFTFMVTGNTGAVTWSIESGNLPAGLSLDTSTGVVSGLPTADSAGLGGTSYFTIRATDGGSGEFLDMPSSIRIYEPPNVTFAAETPIYRGQFFSITASFTGGAPPVFIRVTGFPTSRVRWDPATLTFSGVTNVAPGFHSGAMEVRDGLGFLSVSSLLFDVRDSQRAIQPQKNTVDVGNPDLSVVNFEDGTNTTVDVTNVGGVLTVKVNAPGGGGGSVQSVGGALPDSSGDIAVTSPDGSVGIIVDSSGSLALTAEGGGPTGIRSTIYRALGVLQPGDSATLNDAPACTLTGWRISSRTSGSVSIDVRATTWPTQPGPSESLIGNPAYNIILSAETTHEENDLSNWASTTLSGGERLEFYVVSASGVGAVDITVSIA